MTPEQEVKFLEDVGGLKANIETYHSDTKKALNLITGNGKPEDGILYIMTDIRKGVAGLQKWTESHICETHKQLDDKITELEKNTKTETEVHAIEKKLLQRVMKLLKNPIVISAIAGALAGALGWNKEVLIKIFGG